MRRILVVLVTAAAVGVVAFVGVGLVDPEEAEARSRTKVFTNPNPISFAGAGTGVASPYPSEITVSGFPRGSRVTDVNLTFNSFNSTNPDDVAVMLAKEQRNQGVMADVGGTDDVTNYTFTLDDEATATLPDVGPLQSASVFQYKPARYGSDWPSPAPSALSVFDGINPNGTWQLFIVDDGFGTNSFSLNNGYSLTITARIPRR
jgi:hypothetical protein